MAIEKLTVLERDAQKNGFKPFPTDVHGTHMKGRQRSTLTLESTKIDIFI